MIAPAILILAFSLDSLFSTPAGDADATPAPPPIGASAHAVAVPRRDGLVRLSLSSVIDPGANDAYDGVRIYDAEQREVPYVLDAQAPQSARGASGDERRAPRLSRDDDVFSVRSRQ